MKKKAYNRVCLVNSAYSLFNYLLISTIEEIESTYFFFSYGIPESCHAYFKKQAYIITPLKNKFLNELYEIYIHFFSRCKWPVLKQAELFGMKCGPLFAEIIGERTFTQIEEGGEYIDKVNIPRKLQIIRRFLHGRFYNQHTCNSPYIKNIYLTGQNENASVMKQKNVIRFDILKEWEKSKEKQQLILKAFDVTEKDILSLKSKTDILLTQPLSEDGIITEEEEMNLYKQLIKDAKTAHLCIKPHPRERSHKYVSTFNDSYVFSKKVPLQVLLCLNCNYQRAYTICSTAIAAITQIHTHIQITFAGSKIHPNILKHLGDIELNDYQRTPHMRMDNHHISSIPRGEDAYRDKSKHKRIINRILCVIENRINKPRVNWWSTLYFNFRTQPFKQALKLPVLIYGKTKIISLGGEVEFHDCHIARGLVKIGRSRDHYTHSKPNEIDLANRAKIIFHGHCNISYSCILRIHGILEVDRMTSFGTSVGIFCSNKISIGKHCRIAFNNIIMDSNCHYILNMENHQISNILGEVTIADFNWIGNNTTIMKDTRTIPHTIVASRSLLNKDYSKLTDRKEYLFLAGNPAKAKIERILHRVLSYTREQEIALYFKKNPNEPFMIWNPPFNDTIEDLIIFF